MSPRPVIAGARSAVATGHPLATQAGMHVLAEGGKAFDAALAASLVLAVVEPFSNGLGGDALLLLRGGTGLESVVGIGQAPQAASAELFSGLKRIPRLGPHVVTVPGALGAWDFVYRRYCSMPLRRLLDPAISYATEGFPVSRNLHERIAAARDLLIGSPTAASVFLPDGVPLPTHSTLRQPDLARTLSRLADEGLASFYRGPIGAAVARYLQEAGGQMTQADLAAYAPDVGAPAHCSYRDLQIWETPPPSQGFFLLEMLKALEPFELDRYEPNSAAYISLLARAMLACFSDRDRYLGDPRFVDFPAEYLLSPAHLESLRAHWGIGVEGPVPAAAHVGRTGDTVNGVVADRGGDAVSFIQSNYNAFGSMIIVPGTGILLNNRLSNFALDPGNPNYLLGGKRPAHTLNAVIVDRSGRPFLVYGCPSGDVQIQANLQILANIYWFGMDPQQAVSAPRWYVRSSDPFAVAPPTAVTLEAPIPKEVGDELDRLGFDVSVTRALDPECGGSQTIQLLPERRTLLAGADPRRDGYAAAW